MVSSPANSSATSTVNRLANTSKVANTTGKVVSNNEAIINLATRLATSNVPQRCLQTMVGTSMVILWPKDEVLMEILNTGVFHAKIRIMSGLIKYLHP